MRKVLLFFVLTAVFTMSSVARDKSSDLKKLFELMQSEKMVEETFNNMVPLLKQQASGVIKGNNSQEKVDKYMDFVMEEMRNLVKELVNNEMVSIYDRNFTSKEIRDLIKFYESPTGKKLIEKQPVLTAELMTTMMSKYMPGFQERLIQKLDELKN